MQPILFHVQDYKFDLTSCPAKSLNHYAFKSAASKGGVPAGGPVAQSQGRRQNQFHKAARFRYLSAQAGQLCGEWIVRYWKFYRARSGGWRHPREAGFWPVGWRRDGARSCRRDGCATRTTAGCAHFVNSRPFQFYIRDELCLFVARQWPISTTII